MTNSLQILLKKVIEPDYCIGCGVCASVENSPLKMEFNSDGMYRPVIKREENKLSLDLMKICPFSNESKNETTIGKEVFKDQAIVFDKHTGYHLKNFAGHVKKDDFRENGASGGMASWIASKLLELELVDAIIHVKTGNQDKNEKMYQYDISNNVQELKSGAKSKYYPIELSGVINKIKQSNKRYAVIGIPCFIKSLRLLADNDKVLKEKIKFHIGLVCGHLKSSFFAESMAWEMGISPEELKHFDFRKKFKNASSNAYGVEAKTMDRNVVANRKDLYTTNWGHGFFKYNACEYCDDVLSETADITIGDAWLPEYAYEVGGVNIVVIRNREVLKIIEKYQDELELDEISTKKIYQSQAGGFRHRRNGLSYRLFLKDTDKEYRPEKRVQPCDLRQKNRRAVYKKRLELKDQSFISFRKAKNQNDYQVLVNEMDPLIKEYKRIVTPSFPKKFIIKSNN